MKMPFGKYKGEDMEILLFNFPVGKKYPYYGLWIVKNNILKGNTLEEFKRLLKKYRMNTNTYINHCEKKIERYRDYVRARAIEYNQSRSKFYNTSRDKFSWMEYNDDYAYHCGDYPDF